MIEFGLGILAIIGHIAVWIRLVNMLHGSTLPHGLTHPLTYVFLSWIAMGTVWFVPSVMLGGNWAEGRSVGSWYVYFTIGFGLLAILTWCVRWLRRWCSGVFRYSQERSRVRLHCPGVSQLQRQGSLWLRFPMSQALELNLIERRLEFPDPIVRSREKRPRFSTLRLLHLTDFHFGGGVPLAYYDWALDRILSQQVIPGHPECILLTGDFLDQDDWRHDMCVRLRRLSESTVRHGVWFILGNHDFRLKRTESQTLRRLLVDECGFHDLGGRIHRIHRADGSEMELIGDESPWGRTPEWPRTRVPGAIRSSVADSVCPRIVLTHTPDRFPIWAERLGTVPSLVLAGHTHGGQMRIPGIGAILTPCVTGTQFSDGTFRRGGTLLHLGRGLAAQNPLRLFCPPEATLLEVHAPNGPDGA